MAACGMPSRNLTPQERVTNEWDQMAGEWDDLASGYAAGFEKLLLGKLPDDITSFTVLDFGCGTGLLSDRLRSRVQKIVAMDASSKMMDVLQEKIQGQEWSNTTAMQCVLANLDQCSADQKAAVEAMYGTIDLIVASSVLTFVPEADLPQTMEVLGKFLKPGTGLLVHSDWPKEEAKHPDAMDAEKAATLYAQAGLTAVSTEIVPLPAGGSEPLQVFFGVARKE